MRIIYVISVLSLLVISCGKEKHIPKKEVVEKSSYVSKKWKQTKEIFTESDSVLKLRKEKYYEHFKAFYPEFECVNHWFSSNPKQCLGEKGEYYKMLKNEIDNNNTISHNNISLISENNTYKYLFVSDGAYYIFDLEFVNNQCKYRGVRRIKKGYGTQPVHDLVFDKNGNLTTEVYQGEVEQDLYTKNGHLFFEFEKSSRGQSVKNTIDLGIERKF